LGYKGGVRIHAYAAFAGFSLLLGLAGCGEGDGQPSPWKGPPDAGAEGRIPIESFNAYAQGVDELWEGSAAMAAAQFLRLDRYQSARTRIEAKAGPEGTGPELVTVTLDGLADDSIRALRWILTFSEENDVYTLTGARLVQRCQRDRGHQDFRPRPCV
jgi:hypothetical protein